VTVSGTAERFTLLFVCTGNICRSPMAERLTVASLSVRLPEVADRFDVRSAGTWGYSGAPMDDHALATLAGRGIDGDDFRARELVRDDVVGADLVLAATREHRAAAVVLHPRAAARTFTLREFSRLANAVDRAVLPGDDALARARALVPAAAALRGRVRAQAPGEDDLADPYGATQPSFDACAELIAESLGPVLTALDPVDRTPAAARHDAPSR